MTREELLELYDREVRGSFPDRLPAGWVGEQDGPLTRCLTPQGGFAMFSTDPAAPDRRPARGAGGADVRVLRRARPAVRVEDLRARPPGPAAAAGPARGSARAARGTGPRGVRRAGRGGGPARRADDALGHLPCRPGTGRRASRARSGTRSGRGWPTTSRAGSPRTSLPRSSWSRTATWWSVRPGWCRSRGPRWPVSGAAARWRRTGAVASTGRWWPTGPAGPSTGATRPCRWTPRRTAGRSSSGWVCTSSADRPVRDHPRTVKDPRHRVPGILHCFRAVSACCARRPPRRRRSAGTPQSPRR